MFLINFISERKDNFTLLKRQKHELDGFHISILLNIFVENGDAYEEENENQYAGEDEVCG